MRIKSLPKNLNRVLVCIDSANVAIGLRNLNYSLDYKKFVKAISKKSKKTRFFYYGPRFINNKKHQRFLAFLKKQEIKLRTKEVKVIKNFQLGDHRKANFDVELTIDVVDLQKDFDILLLLSGDSDFKALLEYLHKKKKKIYVLSTRGSIAKELVDESDGYIVISEWKSVLRPYKKSPRRIVGGYK